MIMPSVHFIKRSIDRYVFSLAFATRVRAVAIYCFIFVSSQAGLSCQVLSADTITGNSLVDSLVTEGFKTVDGDQLVLPKPILIDGMSADQQEQALLPFAKDKGRDRFYDAGIKSVFVFDVDEVKELNNKATVRELVVYFVAEGKLDDINEKKLLEDVVKPGEKKQEGALPEGSRELTKDEIEKAKLEVGKKDDGTLINYGSIQANLIDKVHLDVISKSVSTKTDESITVGTRLEPSVAEALNLPCIWQPIERVKNQPTLGDKKESYQAAAGYARATALKNVKDRILVEIHVVFVEPYAWYQGRNLLGSKLPPVINNAVSDFRRKLR